MKILNFGSLNIDHVYSVDHFVTSEETVSSLRYEVFPGGKGLNQSIALARAGGEVFHAVDDPEPGTVIRYIGDEEQPLVYTKPRKGTAAEALYQLLVEHPNETVTRMMVEQRLGRRLGRSALSKAARRLPPWMPVVANYGRGGGFIFAQRTDAPNGSTCLTCTAGRDEGRECALLGGQTAQPHKTTCGAYRARRS